MKIALAQLNTTVGDITGNEAKILAAYQRGVAAGAELVLTPELALTGYPPRDLVLRRSLVEQNLAALNRLAAATGATGLLVGFVGDNLNRPGRDVTNAAALLQNGKITALRTKTLLPTYDVFDEDRYFEPAEANAPVEFNGRKIGITICEDIWNDEDFWPVRRYEHNPPVELAEAGAEIIFNISASPWQLGKNTTRHAMLQSLAKKSGKPVVFCNQVGGNDELVFDGGSLAFNGKGQQIAQGKLFDEDWLMLDLNRAAIAPEQISDEEILFKALTLGLRDYLHKCGFKSAVLGLSGGIDSALVAALAVAALGRENVRGISLPSQFSSPGSLDDARELAANLGIQYDVIPIQPPFLAVKEQLQSVFAGRPEDTTEENIQARLRGVVLMAMSNKFGSLLLTTGNKSELAVGYCTLYGDMCGGLAVISDVPKMMVYRLARWINREREIIPRASITKAPSAELRPNQTDQDSLPPYEVLDAILDAYVVNGQSPADIVKAGFAEADVCRVVKLIDGAEYKRRQAAPGLKVTSKAFGVGRRIPIAQRFRES
ncbi:MAG TPA: NAD+ synthase [Verrucomicrobiae bacterium]|nr:NAD+ synthase [Verrucomicrobiae bacterium]